MAGKPKHCSSMSIQALERASHCRSNSDRLGDQWNTVGQAVLSFQAEKADKHNGACSEGLPMQVRAWLQPTCGWSARRDTAASGSCRCKPQAENCNLAENMRALAANAHSTADQAEECCVESAEEKASCTLLFRTRSKWYWSRDHRCQQMRS